MSTPDYLLITDIQILAQQEQELIFPAFDNDTAWSLGLILRELAVARRHAIVIDIRRFGHPDQPLFYTALAGTTPDNARWVQRKCNVVSRFHRSSYSLGLKLQNDNVTFAEKYSLPDADYATHGGSVPIRVVGAGTDRGGHRLRTAAARGPQSCSRGDLSRTRAGSERLPAAYAAIVRRDGCEV